MSNTIITIRRGKARNPIFSLAEEVNFSLCRGEHLAIVGRNGGGKSLFVDMLTGAHPLLGDSLTYCFNNAVSQRVSDNIRFIAFRNVYGSNEPSYYQQRWNRGDEQAFPTVVETLQEILERQNKELQSEAKKWILEVGMQEHWNKPINLLSSGELRRFQLAKMLISLPQVLIIDNPYIGLDVKAREMLTQLLKKLTERVTIVVVVNRKQDIPSFIRQVLRVENKKVGKKMPLSVYLQEEKEKEKSSFSSFSEQTMSTDEIAFCKGQTFFNTKCSTKENKNVIDFRSITIRYGERTILNHLTWTVHRGEHWALTGENGAGKSTLLSLVCADNPQAYACNINLFGVQRGSGESIWDIKQRIGYVSPEMFSMYRKSLPAIDIVASGLHDTLGLYHRVDDAEREICLKWMRLFGAEFLANQNYLQLSSGEQRLVLLIRAFVKSPELLILDEPFHGLDANNMLRAQKIIDLYMKNPMRTLIMVSHYEEELPSCINHWLKLTKNH